MVRYSTLALGGMLLVRELEYTYRKNSRLLGATQIVLSDCITLVNGKAGMGIMSSNATANVSQYRTFLDDVEYRNTEGAESMFQYCFTINNT